MRFPPTPKPEGSTSCATAFRESDRPVDVVVARDLEQAAASLRRPQTADGRSRPRDSVSTPVAAQTHAPSPLVLRGGVRGPTPPTCRDPADAPPREDQTDRSVFAPRTQPRADHAPAHSAHQMACRPRPATSRRGAPVPRAIRASSEHTERTRPATEVVGGQHRPKRLRQHRVGNERFVESLFILLLP